MLVVDDHEDAAESLSTWLRTLGHSVVSAYDGEAALRQAAAYQPDLVLLDLELPRMNGLEIAEAIRDTPGVRDVRIVAVTGRGDDEARALTKAAGFSAHLVKPLDLEELEATLEAP